MSPDVPAAGGARYAVALGPVTGPATIGESCVDRYLPPISRDTPGGNALNVAAGLAAAGLPTAYVGAVGDDEEGCFVLAQGRARGVDMRHVAVAPGRTGRTTITDLSSGSNTLYRIDSYFQREFTKWFGSWVDGHGCSEWHSDDVRR